MSKAHILVVDDNKLSAQMIRDRLAAAGFDVTTASSAEEALAKLKLGVLKPDLILSDVVMPGMDGYTFCREVRSDPATEHIPVVMLTSRGGVQEKVAGFQAGADDYLVKPVDPVELEVRIRALLARTQAVRKVEVAGKPMGRVISVFSLRGGAGVSSIAVNLAVSLAQLWGEDVSLVDLALEMGQVALMLNVKPQYTLYDLVERHQNGTIDEDVVDGYMLRHETGVRVMAAPPSPELASLITPSLFDEWLAKVRPRYRYVVIDTPSTFSEVTLSALDQSDVIVLVVNPDLASVRAAAAALDVFAALKYSDERSWLVLNWTFPKGGVPLKRLQATLRVPVRAVIPYEQSLFVEAINLGTPVVMAQPTGPAAMVLQVMAYQLSWPDQQSSVPERPTEMWKRVAAALKER